MKDIPYASAVGSLMYAHVWSRHSICHWETWHIIDQSWDWSVEDCQEVNGISIEDQELHAYLLEIWSVVTGWIHIFRIC